MKRILTALVFLPIFYLVVLLPPFAYFLLLAGTLILAVREVSVLAGKSGYRFPPLIADLFCLAILYAFLVPWLQPMWIIAAALLLLPLMILTKPPPLARAVLSTGILLLTVMVLGVLIGFQMQIRLLEEQLGQHLVFFFFLVVWTGDTAAFYVGSSLGKHPLLPGISPKKTIEGSIGGILASMAAGALAAGFFLQGVSPFQGLLVGFLLNLFGQAGDLLESSLKRVSGVKDSAGLLPGHGGILDRLDSLVLAGPVFYLCCHYLYP